MNETQLTKLVSENACPYWGQQTIEIKNSGLNLGLGVHYLVSGVVAFLVAVNWNFIGNWALTFDRPSSVFTQMSSSTLSRSAGLWSIRVPCSCSFRSS